MTQQEKDKLHVKKQNRRYRKLILDALLPSLGIQIFALPLLILGILTRCVVPTEPFRVTFSDCKWESGGRNKSLVLYTAEQRDYMIPDKLRNDFYEDVKSGTVRAGDKLIVRSYWWILRDAIATIETEEKIYGDLETWEAQQKKNAGELLILCAVLNALGAAAFLWILHGAREELSQIRGLRQKYEARLREDPQK